MVQQRTKVPVPTWATSWVEWRLGGRKAARPAGIPLRPYQAWVHAWQFVAFITWRVAGGGKPVPALVQQAEPIPEAWWEAAKVVIHDLRPTPPTEPDPVHPLYVMTTWVNSPENAPSEYIIDYGKRAGVRAVYTQVAHGLQPKRSQIDWLTGARWTPETAIWPAWAGWVQKLKTAGLLVCGWAWGTAEHPYDEGRYHAELTLALGLDGLSANLEEPYDAHADWTSPKVQKAQDYCRGFREAAPHLAATVACLPYSGMYHQAFRDAGFLYMPEAFPLENGKTVPMVIDHGVQYGWPLSLIVPCIQAYKSPAGERYSGFTYAAEAKAKGCKALDIYVAEAAFDEPHWWDEVGTLVR